MLNRNLFVALVFVFGSVLSANANELIWFQTTASVRVDPQWSVFSELQPRWWNGFKTTQAVLVRAAVLYRLAPGIGLGLGFGHTPQFLPSPRNENRIFQQFDWLIFDSGHWNISLRKRLEERFLQYTDEISFRSRGKISATWMPSQFGAYFSDEVFFNLNSAGRQANIGFDQNRFSFGLRHKDLFSTIELGYLLQNVQTLQYSMQWNAGLLLNVSFGW